MGLAYPCGAQLGPAPSHPLFPGLSSGFAAAVVGGAGVSSFNTGRQWTKTGSPAFVMDGQIGPAVNLDVSGKSFTLAGNKTTTPSATGMTFATILRPNALAAAAYTYIYDATNYSFGAASGNFMLFDGSSTKSFSAFSPTVGRPYFFMASTNGTNVNFGATELDTGRQFRQTVATASNGVSGSTWSISFAATNPANAIMSHGAVSLVFLSPAQIAQIVADPWSCWYSEIP